MGLADHIYNRHQLALADHRGQRELVSWTQDNVTRSIPALIQRHGVVTEDVDDEGEFRILRAHVQVSVDATTGVPAPKLTATVRFDGKDWNASAVIHTSTIGGMNTVSFVRRENVKKHGKRLPLHR